MDMSHREPSSGPSAAESSESFVDVVFLSVQYHDFLFLIPKLTRKCNIFHFKAEMPADSLKAKSIGGVTQ